MKTKLIYKSLGTMLSEEGAGGIENVIFLTNYNLNFLFYQQQIFEIDLFLWRDPVTSRHPPTRLRCSETTN